MVCPNFSKIVVSCPYLCFLGFSETLNTMRASFQMPKTLLTGHSFGLSFVDCCPRVHFFFVHVFNILVLLLVLHCDQSRVG